MASKEALIEALGLKDVVRAGWVRAGVKNPESVAAHSWGMAMLATQICPEELDLKRVLQLCILHDIAEVKVGDITPHDNVSTEEKHRLESEAINSMGIDAKEIFDEYDDQNTPAQTHRVSPATHRDYDPAVGSMIIERCDGAGTRKVKH